MKRYPRISIVTPALAGEAHLTEAIESTMSQNYPNIEHIVVDVGTTDGMLARYPHLKLVSEPGGRYVAALNKGLWIATGEICGVLDPGGVLLPDALTRVAQEVDPSRGRAVVLGHCRLLDGQGRLIGIEPSQRWANPRHVLEVWGNGVRTTPPTFWSPEVWRTCGPLDDRLERGWADWDLLCRIARSHRIHAVDQELTAHRVQWEAVGDRWMEADRLEQAIERSRRYWGSPLRPLPWQLGLSLALFRLDRVGRARRYLHEMREAWRRGNGYRAVGYALAAAVLAPDVGFYAAVYPALRDRARGIWIKAADRVGPVGDLFPQTAAYLERTEVWSDGWAGPRLVVSCRAEHPTQAVTVRGWADLRPLSQPLILTVRVDGQGVGLYRVGQPGDFSARISLGTTLPPGTHTVNVEASAWFVPHRHTQNGDVRPLAWRLVDVELDALADA